MGLRDEILAANDLPLEPVECPEWTASKLYVKAMSGKQRAKVENLINSRKSDDRSLKDSTGLRELITCYCLCDESGARVFQDSDVTALGEKNGEVLDRIALKGMTFNKISEAEIEEEEKN